MATMSHVRVAASVRSRISAPGRDGESTCPRCSPRYQRFESAFLQRGVGCELDFLDHGRRRPAVTRGATRVARGVTRKGAPNAVAAGRRRSRDRRFESGFLHRQVCKPSVPQEISGHSRAQRSDTAWIVSKTKKGQPIPRLRPKWLCASIVCPTRAAVAVCFSPEEDCTAFAVHAIDRAETQILVNAYGLTTGSSTIEALVRAKQRGVEVRLIADRTTPCERNSGVGPPARAAIPIWIDYGARIAHTKSMVIDGTVTLTGSMNWNGGAALNSENLNLVASPTIAAAYAGHWRQRLALSSPYTQRQDWCRKPPCLPQPLREVPALAFCSFSRHEKSGLDPPKPLAPNRRARKIGSEAI
jgi:phospholipase D